MRKATDKDFAQLGFNLVVTNQRLFAKLLNRCKFFFIFLDLVA